MKKKKRKSTTIVNKKAKAMYQIYETVEAGVVLNGAEVKSLRRGRTSLRDSFARVRNGEGWVHNWLINPYEFAENKDYDPKRARKILLNKKQLLRFEKKTEGKRWMLVPLKVYLKGRVFKVELGLGRGKKKYERKAELKKRDQEREVDRELKHLGLR